MCGRYKLTTPIAELAAALGASLDERLAGQRARYNVAPTDVMPVVVERAGARVLAPMRWGLVPFWARDLKIGSTMINARSETAFEKPAFREALLKRRCLVVVDGFYEWAPGPAGEKTPTLISFDGAPFTLAGLWARWQGEPGVVETFTILTTSAGATLRGVHDRMPVLVDEAVRGEWLDAHNDVVDLERLAASRPWPGVTLRPVSSRVGNVRNDDEAVLTADVLSTPTPKVSRKKKPRPAGSRASARRPRLL